MNIIETVQAGQKSRLEKKPKKNQKALTKNNKTMIILIMRFWHVTRCLSPTDMRYRHKDTDMETQTCQDCRVMSWMTGCGRTDVTEWMTHLTHTTDLTVGAGLTGLTSHPTHTCSHSYCHEPGRCNMKLWFYFSNNNKKGLMFEGIKYTKQN